MRLLNRLILLTILVSIFNACEQTELSPETQFEEIIRKTSVDEDENLSEILTESFNLSNSRTSETIFFNSELGKLQLDQIVETLTDSDQPKSNYTIKLIPQGGIKPNRQTYLVLVAIADQYYSYINQYERDSSRSTGLSYFDGFTGTANIYNLEWELLSIEYFEDGTQLNNKINNGRTKETYTNCDCKYAFEYTHTTGGTSEDGSFGTMHFAATGIDCECDLSSESGGTSTGDGSSSGSELGSIGTLVTSGGESSGEGVGSTGGGTGEIVGFEDIPTSTEEIESYLNFKADQNPNILIELDCEQLKKWQSVATHKPSTSVIHKINQLEKDYPNAAALFTGDFEIQNIEDANGTTVNMDFFPVKVSRLPDGMSADDLITEIRTNINNFIDTEESEFTPFNLSNEGKNINYTIKEDELWNSDSPLGSVIHIDIPLPAGDGSVVCSYKNHRKWRFTTISAPYDWEHPVSGTREFGYESNSDGTYTFYTRGVDRVTEWIDKKVAENLIDNPFEKPDKLWRSFQSGIENFINQNGGSASKDNPVIGRPNWNEVKDVLQGLKHVESLNDCN